MLYSKKQFILKPTLDRRPHNSSLTHNITDLNINERIAKFQDQLENEFVSKIPLRYFTDLGKINFQKIDATSKQTWRNCSNPKKVTTVRLPDTKIIFTKLFQYEQILFLKGSWFLKISYAWELKKHRYKKHMK